MYIINTTFHVDLDSKDSFIKWIKEYYIPNTIESNILTSPQLTRIISGDDDKGISLSLQFKADDLDLIDAWYKAIGKIIVKELERLYSGKVTGFSTIMENIDL